VLFRESALHASCAVAKSENELHINDCAVPEQFGIYAFGIATAVYVHVGTVPSNPSVFTRNSFRYDAAKTTARAATTITTRVCNFIISTKYY